MTVWFAVAVQQEASEAKEKEIAEREDTLMPAYQQVAVAFAGMHDKPARMIAKGVVKDIVPWLDARRVLATRLRRRSPSDIPPFQGTASS